MAKSKRKRPAKSTDWHPDAIECLRAYQTRHLEALCSLPELFAHLTAKCELTIGQFHDGLREMVLAGKVRLHPFSGPRSALEGSEYALVMNREIMYYAECV